MKKKISRTIVRLILGSILVLAFNGKSFAQTYYYNFNITVTPESPTRSDEIEVKVSLEPSSISYNVTFGSLGQIDNQFLVDIVIYVPEMWFPMLGYEEKTYDLGKLPDGTYSFNATVTVTGWGSGVTHHNKSFFVASTHVYPGQSIQNAINSAQLGDAIFVHNGTYYENVVVNKSVSLIGEGIEATIIDGNGNGTVVYVFVDDVNISGFTVRNSGYWPVDGGIYLNNSQGCRINGNEISVEGSGIIVSAGSGNHLINNRIGSWYSWYGIYLINSSGNMIAGNTQYNSDIGIKLVEGSCYNNITGNHITARARHL